ncbi:antitoxin Xre/MbcA/ParS toxin-binding domain-containing protein [Roseibium aestuarii]|uniref:Antitoxin Xre/MbcA/ParS toxin-binding domain-containing protein n=1 Tax=Roseibium aestuarii TaxID=2600299 RepID=A0ABW4JW63_9HYPH|nr:antitoxin Xre/MbcA/ParS toxin-binding domain-containing protein [Roseibium aestuarii]
MLEPKEAVAVEPDAVVSKAVVRAAVKLGLTQAALARVLGLSEASVSRLYHGELKLSGKDKAFELSLLLIRLFRSLDALVGGDERVLRRWMETPNTALGGVPRDLIAKISGLTNALAYVDSRRARL